MIIISGTVGVEKSLWWVNVGSNFPEPVNVFEVEGSLELPTETPDLLIHLHGAEGLTVEEQEASVGFIEKYYLAKKSPMLLLNIDEFDSQNEEHSEILTQDIENMLRKTRGYAFAEQLKLDLDGAENE